MHKNAARAAVLVTRIDENTINNIQHHFINIEGQALLFNKAQIIGIIAARNLIYFMISFILRRLSQVFVSCMKHLSFRILDVFKSFLTDGLIFVVNQSILIAFIDTMSLNNSKGSADIVMYVRYYEA